VEFYRGSTLIGSDATAPYAFSWTSVPAGTYVLTAKATDDVGAVTTSSSVTITVTVPANQPPTITLTSPAGGATVTAPATIALAATAADSDGTVAKVEFYQGAISLATDTTPPYSFSWASVPAGTYVISAKATDDGSAVTTSASVTITVAAPTVATPPASDPGGTGGNGRCGLGGATAMLAALALYARSRRPFDAASRPPGGAARR
jgi:hypothetical protein